MASKDVRAETPVAPELVVAVVDQFLDWVQRRKAPRTYEWYHRHLQNLTAELPRDLTVAKLRSNDVTQIIDAHDEWSSSTKHGFARCVKRAFRWAVDEGLIERSPVRRLDKPEAEARDIVISDEEYATILEIVKEPNFRDLIVAAWETGARPRELLTVEARYVQHEHGRWVFPKKKAKGKRLPRAVYLTDTAAEITKRLMDANPTGPLFRNSNGRPWNRWSINCAFGRLRVALGKWVMKESGVVVERPPRFSRSKVDPAELEVAREAQEKRLAERRKQIVRLALELGPPYNLGAFRHTFGDRALKRGVDPITVANLMGHRNLAMLANTYSHLNQDGEYLRQQAMKAASR